MPVPAPYRHPEAPVARGDAPDPPDLGPLRSEHVSPPLARALAPALAVCALIALSFASMSPRLGLAATGVGLGLTAVLFAILAIGPLRRRGTRVAVHADGVAVEQRRARDAVAFADVDEVWFEALIDSTPAGARMALYALRLVDRAGAAHRVPLHVHDAGDVANVVLRRCSFPLLAEARAVLAAGEVLTFARVRLSRERVEVGGDALAWRDMGLVRTQPGRVAFLRPGALLPWKTVSLDEVPHPTLFLQLVSEHAPRVENDDPLAGWFR